MENLPNNSIPKEPTINNNHEGHEENVGDNIVQDVARPKLLQDYFIPCVNDPNSSINPPTVANQKFEIKPALINMVSQQQFGRMSSENPHLHLSIFLSICEMIQINGVTDDAIRLTLFQKEGESLCEAWDRYKDMLRCCPYHGLERWLIVQSFYDGLKPTARLSIDASAEGEIMYKELDDAYNLIEQIAINQHTGPRSARN